MARHFDDILADATGMDARSLYEREHQTATDGGENENEESQSQSQTGSLAVGGIGLEAVAELEKTDLMFWLIAIQTLLLLLIWLELLRR